VKFWNDLKLARWRQHFDCNQELNLFDHFNKLCDQSKSELLLIKARLFCNSWQRH